MGLASAVNAPAGPPRSNKADGYGGPVQQAPKNPQSVAACNKYYGSGNNTTQARDCRAQAKRNAALKKCAKKNGAKRAACKKAAKKQFAKEEAAIKKQQKAESACRTKYNFDLAALDPNAEDYSQKMDDVIAVYNAYIKKAQGG